MTLPTPLVRALLAGLVRPVLGPPVPLPVQRAFLAGTVAALRPLTSLPAGTRVVRDALGGRPTEVVTAPGADGPPVLLLHGGAFTTCSPSTHRGFATALSAAAGAPVHVLDHRRAPEHPYPAAVDDAVAALTALGPAARLVGDSAGGALALLALLRLRDEGRPLPPAVALVSPFVDFSLTASAGWAGPDPLLRQGWLRTGVSAFAGPSPLDADLAGLPRVLVHVSSDERLRPEGEELVRRLGAAGGDVALHVVEGAWHDVHLQAGLVVEADAAVEHLGRWLR